jgi:tellurite resistance protein
MPVTIFGKKWVGIPSTKGSFYCPECRTQRNYSLKKHTRFFAVLNLPVLPFKSHGKHIECGKCKQTFWESVLECSPEITKKGLHPSILKLMVLIMLADGRIEKEEMETIIEIYKEVTSKDITVDDINGIIESSKTEDISIEEYLKRIKPYLGNYNKELIVKCSFLVSKSDGEIMEEEKILLYEICNALSMTVQQFNSILKDLQSLENEDDPEDIFLISEDDA